MMVMQELEITIDMEGRVALSVRGGKGQDCLALTGKIENAIGDVSERVLLPEYYEYAAVTEQQHVSRKQI